MDKSSKFEKNPEQCEDYYEISTLSPSSTGGGADNGDGNLVGDELDTISHMSKRKLSEMIIQYYKEHKVLWDTTDSGHRNNLKHHEAYENITKEINALMGTNFKWLQIKIEIDKLKTKFRKESNTLAQFEQNPDDGSDSNGLLAATSEESTASWLYKQMEFLKDHIESDRKRGKRDIFLNTMTSTILHQKSSANEQLSDVINILAEINNKVDSLTDQFTSFKHNTKQQNSIVVDSLGENVAAMKNLIKDQTPKYTKQFPIKSLEDLKTLEESINDKTEKDYIASIRAIIGKRGLLKGLTDIVVPKVLVNFNVEGIHNKMRLLNYENFINALFMGSYDNDGTQKSFKDDLKHAIKLAKNRHFKEKMKQRCSTDKSTNA